MVRVNAKPEAVPDIRIAKSREYRTASQRRAVRLLWLLAVILGAVALASIGIGMVYIAPGEAVVILVQHSVKTLTGTQLPLPWQGSAQQEAVLLTIRLPRVILGMLIGASLAVSGAAMQGLFRNPLADPGLLGLSSGAALAAVTVIVLGATGLPQATRALGLLTLPLAAFVGCLAATWVLYTVSQVGGRTVVATMLLAGIAINALAQSGIGILSFIASDAQLRSVVFWSLSSLGGASWVKVWPALMGTGLVLGVMLQWLVRPLNVLLLGEAEAVSLGIHLPGLTCSVLTLVALGVGASVAVAGSIGFVGLVVPHLLRLLIGPDHRYRLLGSALLGAILMLPADLVARTALVPAELPISIVTAAMGAPFFLFLLVRQHRQGRL